MYFTKVQISELMRKHAQKENGLHDLLEIMIESMMVAERGELRLRRRAIRAMVIVLVIPTVMAVDWSSAFRETATATFIHRFWPFFGTRRRTVNAWQEACTQRVLPRSRSARSSRSSTASTTPKPQSPVDTGVDQHVPHSIERLNRDFRRVIKMRTAMPNEESVITLIGSVAMEHKPFDRQLPNITTDKSLFPD